MTHIELSLACLVCIALAWIGSRIGFKMYLFVLLGILTFSSAVTIPFFFYKQIGIIFHGLIHPILANGLTFLAIVLCIVVPGLIASKKIEGSIATTMSESGNRATGILFGLTLGVVLMRFVLI